MNWVIWQQHKKQFLTLGLLLILAAAFLIPTGIHYWNVYQDALTACLANSTAAECRSELSTELFKSGITANIFDAIKFVVVAIPVLLATFFGLSLIGREYTDGTNLLAWTQGISRRKWLTAKMAWTLGATVSAAAVVVALHTWWWHTGNDLWLTRFQPLDFAVQGIVPIAITFFAVAVAIALGAWFKRTLPALGALLVIIIVTQSVVPMVARPNYAAPRLHKSALYTVADKSHRPDRAPIPTDKEAIWITEATIVNNQGQPLDWIHPPRECSHTVEELERMFEEQAARDQSAQRGDREPNRESYIGRAGGPEVGMRCIAEKGYHWEVYYQPANQYWKFQAIESALYVLLSVPFIAFTYWLVLRRDA
jgi:hypothetical protein